MSNNELSLHDQPTLELAVREIIKRQNQSLLRWMFLIASLAVVAGISIVVYIIVTTRYRFVEPLPTRMDELLGSKVSLFRAEVDQKQESLERILATREADFQRKMSEVESEIAALRSALRDTQAELAAWRTDTADKIGETREKLSLANATTEQLTTELTTVAENAQRLQAQVDTMQERVGALQRTISTASDSSLATTDVEQLVDRVTKSVDFQDAILSRLTGDPNRTIDLHGQVRLFGSLTIANPIDSGESTSLYPGIVRFDGTDGGTIHASSVKIAGGKYGQGVLRILDRGGHDAIRLTFNNILPGYPNGGMILLQGDPTIPSQRAGIFLNGYSQYNLAFPDTTGQWH